MIEPGLISIQLRFFVQNHTFEQKKSHLSKYQKILNQTQIGSLRIRILRGSSECMDQF